MKMSKSMFTAFGLLAAIAVANAGPQPPEPPPFEKPKPPPAQVSSSESTIPLPLPAVMQKRQEKKNPPQPPVLLTKIKTDDAEDWARTPDDLKGLLEWMSREVNVHFTANIKSYRELSTDPTQNPVIYRSGYKAFKLSDREIAHLREYVMNGGTVIFNPLVGHPNFYASALEAAQQILPDRPPYRLRMDHPVYHSFYEISRVAYNQRRVTDGLAEPYPHIEGVDLDNRTAIFISRWDLSMAWESNKGATWGYSETDARKIGANIICYTTAMKDAGRSIGKSVELVNSSKQTASKFRVGQIIHDGPWKTRTAAFPMLLNQFHTTTGAPVSFELRDVSLKDSSVFECPFLYLTGTTDFQFTETERANLRRFLTNGGVLFAEASEGRTTFDAAFRAEMAQILPGRQLGPLTATHALFQQPKPITKVKARPALALKKGNQIELSPEMYGIEVNGTMAVIYSPYDLSAGWERAVAPYAVGYEAADSTALGVNVLFQAVAH